MIKIIGLAVFLVLVVFVLVKIGLSFDRCPKCLQGHMIFAGCEKLSMELMRITYKCDRCGQQKSVVKQNYPVGLAMNYFFSYPTLL